MSKLFSVRVTERDFRVLEGLFEFRGMTIIQLLRLLDLSEKTGRSNMYRTLNKLYKMGLVDFDIIGSGDKKSMYFLSPKGYSFMLNKLYVPDGYVGKGFGRDFGCFSYLLARPPKRYKKHHGVVVDVLLAAKEFKRDVDSKQPNHNTFDYRDNRYASRNYTTLVEGNGSKPYNMMMNLRPDAELLIHSEVYFIEVDMGTERGEKIRSKFEGYKAYFDYLIKSNNPLPAGIIFVVEELNRSAPTMRRWHSLVEKYIDVMGDYAGRVNLMIESVERFEKLLAKEYYRGGRYESSLTLLRKSINQDGYKGTGIKYFNRETGLIKLGEVLFVISELDSSKTLFIYHRVDGFETLGWILLQKFMERLEDKELRNRLFDGVDRIVPITWYRDDMPVEPWRLADDEVDRFFSKRLHFKIAGEDGAWENIYGEEIENPLISSNMLAMGVPFTDYEKVEDSGFRLKL